jgi:hypothetical protein
VRCSRRLHAVDVPITSACLVPLVVGLMTGFWLCAFVQQL